MVVACVVDTVAGEEVEDDSPVFGMEFGTATAAVLDVHTEKIEESNPLGIDEVAVGVVMGCGYLRKTFRFEKSRGQAKDLSR
jgi:hypothetical protein